MKFTFNTSDTSSDNTNNITEQAFKNNCCMRFVMKFTLNTSDTSSDNTNNITEQAFKNNCCMRFVARKCQEE